MINEYLAAFDVGGTKLDAVLFDKTGKIVKKITDSGGIPLEIGLDKACELYISALKKLFCGVDGKIVSLYASVAAIEYFGDGLLNRLKSEFHIEKTRVEGDGMSLISAVLGHKDGCSIICGTGSALFVRKGDEYYHTGGWGHLIDSCGSGFVLGRMAFQAAYRYHDGRGEKTVLLDILNKRCGEPIWDHYPKLYEGGRSYIASFASTVFEARNMGDRVAQMIFNTCAEDLAELIWVVKKQLGYGFDLVYNGGIFYNFREYAVAVSALAPNGINHIFSDVKPIYGSAVEAMYSIGLECGEKFKNNFLSTY